MSQAGGARAEQGIDADTHLTILAALNFLGGGLVLLGGLIAAWGIWFGVGAGTAYLGPFGWVIPGVVESIIGVIVLVAIAVSLPAILGGIGLVQRSEWGRVMTIVTAAGVGLFAIVSFTLIPLAYSVYAFWVLTREEVTARLRTVDAPSAPRQVDGDDATGREGGLRGR